MATFRQNREYRIYFRQFDENYNLIGEGVSTKSYKRESNAWNAAEKLYRNRNGIVFCVGWRNPFEEYLSEATCPICGKVHMVREHHIGYDESSAIIVRDYDYPRFGEGPMGTSDDLRRQYCTPSHFFHDVCKECMDKVEACIKSIMEENGNES